MSTKKILTIVVVTLLMFAVPAMAAVTVNTSGNSGYFMANSWFENPLVNYLPPNPSPFGYTGGVLDGVQVFADSVTASYTFDMTGSTFGTTLTNGSADWQSLKANNSEKFSQSYQPSYFEDPGIVRTGQLNSDNLGIVSRVETWAGGVIGLSTSTVVLSASSTYSGFTDFAEVDLNPNTNPGGTPSCYSSVQFSGVGTFGMTSVLDRTNMYGPPAAAPFGTGFEGTVGFPDRGRIALLEHQFGVSATGTGTFTNVVIGGPSNVAYGPGGPCMGGYALSLVTHDAITTPINTGMNLLNHNAPHTFTATLTGSGDLWSNIHRHDSRILP